MLQGFGHVQHHTSYGHGHIWGWHVRQISIWWLHICALIEQARSWHCSKNITAARCNFPGILRIWSWFYRDWLYIAGYQMLPYKKHIYMYIFQTNNIHQFIPIFSPLVLHPHWTNNKPWQTQQGRISERRFTTFAQLMKRHGLISQLHSLRRHNQGRQLKKMKSEVWNLRFDPDEHLWHMNIYEHLWTSMKIYEHLWTSRNI